MGITGHEDRMKEGICPLCRKEAKLCESHLISASIYPLCQNDKREHVSVTPEVMRPTQKQTKAPLLCQSCEDNLSKNGERYVIPLLARLDGTFPLYDRLVKQDPLEKTNSMTVYAAASNPEVDAAKLIHFGIGILWKASVCPFGKGDAPRIDLGDDGEALRRFLLGEADLPPHLALAVAVESGPIRLPAMIDPFPGDNPDFKSFFFYVPGMVMQLYIGENVRQAKGAYSINLNPAAPVLLVPLAKDMRGSLAKHSRDAYKTEKLLKTTAELDAKGLSIRLGE